MNKVDELLTALHPVSARRLVPCPPDSRMPEYGKSMSDPPEGMRWETDQELWGRVAKVADDTVQR